MSAFPLAPRFGVRHCNLQLADAIAMSNPLAEGSGGEYNIPNGNELFHAVFPADPTTVEAPMAEGGRIA